MASLFTHAAWTALAVRARPGAALPRRVLIAAGLCAIVADLDFALSPFSQHPGDLWAHRGLLHSPLFLLVLAVVGAALVTPRGEWRQRLWRYALVLWLAGCGHVLLDLLTWGGPGTALLAPFSEARFQLPRALRLAPVVPVGMDEWLGRLGVQVLAVESLFILLPTLLLVRGAALPPEPAARRGWTVLFGAWALLAAALRVFGPTGFSLPPERVISALPSDPGERPEALPGPALVTRFDELQARGLFNRPLVPTRVPWSSEFYPFWFGGQAGRWRDSVPTLVGRTLFGVEPPSAPVPGDGLFWLSPTEKYDLASGAVDFPATKAALAETHNRRPRPRFWFGLCNGAAAAALALEEPFRTVDVVARDGRRIRFHPNDVKALLAAAYYQPAEIHTVSELCTGSGFDVSARCSVHPAAFALAVLNRLGIGGQSFVVEVHPTKQSQYHSVAGATVRLTREPYAPSSEPLAPELAPRVAKLVDVDIELSLSSTLLPASATDVLDPKWPEGSGYAKVGARPLVQHYPMTLALDASGEIVGGRYTGDPPDGPDQLGVTSPLPSLRAEGIVDAAPPLRWQAIEALARASVSTDPSPPFVDVKVFDASPAAP
ncbi:metal-dependent hydrolase [Corallococcus sp. M7]